MREKIGPTYPRQHFFFIITPTPNNIFKNNVVGSRGHSDKNVVGGRGVQIFLSYRPSPNFKNGTALSCFVLKILTIKLI